MKLITWGLIVVGLFYAAYTVFLAVSDYFEVAEVVNQAMAKVPRERFTDRAAAVKRVVLTGVRQAGVPVEENNVVVTDNDRALSVSVTWSHAVLVVRGESVFALPLWVERTSP